MAGKVGSWQRLIATLDANAGEIPHLQALRDRLETMVGQVADLQKQQAAHRAAMQGTTQQFQEMVVEGQRLATLLRQSVKQHYGIRAEKLAEFGVQPFRGRRAQEEVPPPASGIAVPTPETTGASVPPAGH